MNYLVIITPVLFSLYKLYTMKWELTVTLKPCLYRLSACEQYDITSPYLKDILRHFDHTSVAEVTNEHNVHYHSMIEIEDDPLYQRQKELMERFRPYVKVFGKKSFRPVQYEDAYEAYLQKDLKKTLCIVNRQPVLQDDLGIIKDGQLNPVNVK